MAAYDLPGLELNGMFAIVLVGLGKVRACFSRVKKHALFSST